MADTSPREKFDRLVKATAERLRPLGFSRRGMVLRIKGTRTNGLIQFQRSMANSQDMLRFTVNLGVVCGDLLGSGLAGLPKAGIADSHVRERIGFLLPESYDKWWEITAHTDADPLEHEVVNLIADKAVPYINQYLTVDSILALWESGQCPGLTDRRRTDLLATLKTKQQGGGI